MNIRKIFVALVFVSAIMGSIGSVSAISRFDSFMLDRSYEAPDYMFDGFRVGSLYEVREFNIEKPSNLPISRSCSRGYLEASYTSTFNGKTITGSRIDNIPPFRIAEDIPFNGATFHFRVFANRWP
jgi:hypothetical protein